MSKTSILNGILIGLVVVLAGVILVQDSGNNVAAAAERNRGGGGGAATTSGVGLGSNGVIAVTGQFLQYNSVLYLIDTNREVILTYACYSKGSRNPSTAFNKPYLTFLNGRVYTYDAAYAKKSPKGWGAKDGPTPGNMRSLIKDDD